MKVSEAIARSLINNGVEVVFSLLGDTNMDIVVHLADLGIPVHESRHEATAMAMAEGYARASGKLAVCSVTCGPGLAHTFVPLVSASRREPSPVIVLTGPHSRDNRENRQHLDHEGLSRLAGVSYRPIASPGVAVDRVDEVADLARSEGKPVVFDVPADIQAMAYPADMDEAPRPMLAWRRPQSIQPDPAAIAAAVDVIGSKVRPVVLAGGGAATAESREELIGLADELGALLATTVNARGLFHGDRFNAGVAGRFALPASAELFTEADCVIAFGASLNSHTTAGGDLFPWAQFVQVDIKPPGPMESGDVADAYVQGDAAAVARALRAELPGGSGREGFRTGKVADRLNTASDPTEFEIDPGEIDPRALCENLDALLPDECGFVTGAGHFWSFPQMYMSRWRSPLLQASYHGAIGYAVSVGIGAALASQQPIVVFDGDGSFMMHSHAIETAARAGARILVIVMNDGALGAEFHKLTAKGLNPELSTYPRSDLAGIATLMGSNAATLSDLRQLPAIVDEFLDGDGPLLVDAHVSRNVISRPMRLLHFGGE